MESISVKAPGRINLIGEHTDYNQGFVLPAAIDRYVYFEIEKNGSGGKVNAAATDLGESFSFELDAGDGTYSDWQRFIYGVVSELIAAGAALEGFNCTFHGTVPRGGGMSSSAALECALALGLNQLFGLGFDRVDLMHIVQKAEHKYVGTQCGIMDQYSSLMGREGHFMLLDCRSLSCEHIPFESSDWEFLVLDTGVAHSLARSEYNQRRAECEEAVAFFRNSGHDVNSLRDVSPTLFMQYQQQLPDTLAKRCWHVIFENNRVRRAANALKNSKFEELGALMYASHESLCNNYEVSCPELDFLVDFTRDKSYLGGARMMGGGFGGCTINLVKKTYQKEFVGKATRAYHNRFGIDLKCYSVQTANGAHKT